MSARTIGILIVIAIVVVAIIFFWQKSKKWKEGGYTGFNIFIVGERGKEYIVPAWLLKENPFVQAQVDEIEKIRTEKFKYK